MTTNLFESTQRPAADALVDALDELATSARLSVSRAALRRSVSLALAMRRDVDWPEALRTAGGTVGLAVSLYELSPKDVTTHASDLLPLVTVIEGTDGPRVVAVQQENARELADVLGIAPTDRAVFAAAEPTASLDVMRASVTNGGAPLSRLYALFRLEKDDLWVTVIYAVAVGLLSLATPLGVQTLVNTVAFGALMQPLVVLTTLLLAGLAFAGVLRALQAWVVERVQQRLFVRTALDLAHRLPRVDAGALRDAHGPEIVNRFFDVVTMQKGVATLLVDGIAIVLQTIVGMLILSLYHPMLLAFAVILAASIAFIVLVLGRNATPTALKESKAKYAVAAWLQEVIRHRTTFGSEDGSRMGVTHAEDLTREWLAARRKHYKVVFRQLAGALVLQAVASAALLGVGGALVIARQLTLGQLVAAELIVTAVVAGFSKLGKYFESFYDLLASVDKIGTLVDLPLERAGTVVRGHGPASLVLGELEVERGGRVGIHATGPRSAQLVDVLATWADPGDERFEIDACDARDLAPAAIRTAMMVVRAPEIFAGTVAENLARGRPSYPGTLRAALELVGLRDLALDAPLATNAPSLGRERAVRLALARALVAEPRILVVDRILDVLAPEARDALIDVLAAPSRPWTLVVVSTDRASASRLAQVMNVDRGGDR